MAKKHGHEDKHAHCEHCLHACDHCDVAYCCDCNREWGTCRQTHYYTYPYYPYYQIPCGTSDPLSISGGGGTSTLDLTGTSPMVGGVFSQPHEPAHAHGHEN